VRADDQRLGDALEGARERRQVREVASPQLRAALREVVQAAGVACDQHYLVGIGPLQQAVGDDAAGFPGRS
jgi:hypothetical protein